METLVRRSALLIAVYGVAAVISLWISRTLTDFDYGLHLRTGEWVVEHGWVPDAEVFSSQSSTPRWVAYSWSYEVLLWALRAVFGVWSQIVLAVALSIGLAHALFTMIRGISGRTGPAAGLTLIGIVAMAPMLYGRSVLLTAIFATIELQLLVRATVLDDRRALFYVPLVFAVWANVHIQFLYGLFLYGCFGLQAWLDVLTSRRDADASARARGLATRMTWIGVACVLATLVNPYTIRIYDPIVRYLFQTGLISQIQEFMPPRLTSIPTWMSLALALLVALVAGRRLWERPVWLLMFGFALYVGLLRSARDAWFPVVTGSALLAVAIRSPRSDRLSAQPLAVALGTACAIAVAAQRMEISGDSLRAHLREQFPVDAAAFIESEDLKGPMYNHFNWGGYLMMRLPRWPVSIDGRTYVYDTEYLLHSLRIWGAEPGWEEDPQLLAAGFVVGSQTAPLTVALKRDERFRLVYEDRTAAVFVPSAAPSRNR